MALEGRARVTFDVKGGKMTNVAVDLNGVKDPAGRLTQAGIRDKAEKAVVNYFNGRTVSEHAGIGPGVGYQCTLVFQ